MTLLGSYPTTTTHHPHLLFQPSTHWGSLALCPAVATHRGSGWAVPHILRHNIQAGGRKGTQNTSVIKINNIFMQSSKELKLTPPEKSMVENIRILHKDRLLLFVHLTTLCDCAMGTIPSAHSSCSW